MNEYSAFILKFQLMFIMNLIFLFSALCSYQCHLHDLKQSEL